MRKTYGKDAGTHCMYAMMNNQDNPQALEYWREVERELKESEQ
jgi:hypothetical protein